MKTLILAFLLLALAVSAHAVERKDLKAVNIDQLTSETQIVYSEDGVHLVWWMPPEFWEASLLKENSMTREQVEQVMNVLRPYSMLAVVQADVSPFGVFTFYDKQQVAKNLEVRRKLGKINSKIDVVKKVPDDLKLLQNQLKPILAAALGNMGQNFHFFVFEEKKNGKRIASPYEKGILSILLVDKQGKKIKPFDFETPLNAMFVPRICPNGREAHVSWKVCPWDGTRLSD